MNTDNIYIGEIYEKIKDKNKIIAKRIGFKSLYYSKNYNSYISLSNRCEYYLESSSTKCGERYIKEGTLIPYSSFAKKTSNKELIKKNLKNKIEELLQNKNQEKDIIKVRNYTKISWEDFLSLATHYYEHFNNLEVPYNFNTKNGYEFEEDGIPLGPWIFRQRQLFNKNKLSKEKLELLSKIGMRFTKLEHRNNDISWNRSFELATIYYEHHGNLEMKDNFKTINGYEYHKKGLCLGKWLVLQQKAYYKGELTEEQIESLKSIKFHFNKKDAKEWFRYYKLASIYYEHFGNLRVPATFKTVNGIDYDENGERLGIWLRNQREEYKTKTLLPRKITLLNKIGMIWNVRDEQWEKLFNLASVFYDHYGNLEVPQTFKTSNGYEYSSTGENLGTWINTLRQLYKKGKLDESKINDLRTIGMRFNVHSRKNKWMTSYDLASRYSNYYGNLDVPANFKTINGYEYDDKGIDLGTWILYQRKLYCGLINANLTSEEINMLESIGMIWFNGVRNQKLISETIKENNKGRKAKEVTNRFQSILNQYDENHLPTKEELNTTFVKRISRV